MKSGPAASPLTALSSMRILGGVPFMSYNLVSRMEGSFLNGSLGLDVASMWVLLHFMPAQLV